MFKNKTILITGATGSFGEAFLKKILSKKFNFKKIIVFSRDELKQHEMKTGKYFNEKTHKNLRYIIGDVRDGERLQQALKEVDFVIHAAALKQVPTGEYNPFEVIKTNVLGSQNLITSSIICNVKKVIALSTDKAVSPVNLYGASKLCSDKLFISSNNIVGKQNISFAVVRYGNVSGSRGSVIPEFIKQQKKGVFKITHKDMTRFNISLEDSIDMVIWSLKNTIGGEVVVPKCPSFRITDLAKAIDSKCKIKFTGIRQGEKIHEELISRPDYIHTFDIGKYYVILQNKKKLITYYKNSFGAKKTPANFSYSSDQEKLFLSVKKIRKIFDQYKRKL